MIRKSSVLLCAVLIFGACGPEKKEVVYQEKCQKIVAHKYYRITPLFSRSDVERYIVLEDGNEIEVGILFGIYDVGRDYCVGKWVPKYAPHPEKGGTPG